MKGYPALVVITLFVVATVLAGQANRESPQGDLFETRCGWFSNPTPGNISLYDRDGEWIIGIQGGHQVKGDWEWPVFRPKQWIATNVHYGYGCACFEMKVDHLTHHVTEIRNSHAKSLKSCRQDRSLKKWKGTFK